MRPYPAAAYGPPTDPPHDDEMPEDYFDAVDIAYRNVSDGDVALEMIAELRYCPDALAEAHREDEATWEREKTGESGYAHVLKYLDWLHDRDHARLFNEQLREAVLDCPSEGVDQDAWLARNYEDEQEQLGE